MERTAKLLTYEEDGREINDQKTSSSRVDDNGDVNTNAVLNNSLSTQPKHVQDAGADEPTDPTTDQPAQTQFFATQELLEMLLVHLPIRDILLRAPLVSKHWKATIDTSPTLQHALFFRPVPGKTLRLYDSIRNPYVSFWAEKEDAEHIHTVFANPFYLGLKKRSQQQEEVTGRQRTALDRPEASWRRMRIVQPEVEVTALSYPIGDVRPDVRSWETKDVKMVDLSVRSENGAVVFRQFLGSPLWREVEYGSEVGRLWRKREAWV